MSPSPIKEIQITKRFKRQYEKADDQLKADVDKAVADLYLYPVPRLRRFHPLNAYKNPRIYKIDVRANKSWQISREIYEGVATLRCLADHKDIDRLP